MKTKAYRVIAVAAGLMAGAAGCTDVTTEPQSTVTETNAFQDPGSYRAFLAKIYGGLHKGYPDAKMAKAFAAKAAIEDLKVKVALTGTNFQAMGQPLPWSSDDINRDRAYPSADRYRSDPVGPPHEVATESVDAWRPQGSYLNEVDSWRPMPQGDKWRPEAATAGAGVGVSSGKRGPAQSLLKENAPLQKKVKREPGYSDFDAPLGDTNPSLDYGRVEHVDGRYGFGP